MQLRCKALWCPPWCALRRCQLQAGLLKQEAASHMDCASEVDDTGEASAQGPDFHSSQHSADTCQPGLPSDTLACAAWRAVLCAGTITDIVHGCNVGRADSSGAGSGKDSATHHEDGDDSSNGACRLWCCDCRRPRCSPSPCCWPVLAPCTEQACVLLVTQGPQQRARRRLSRPRASSGI